MIRAGMIRGRLILSLVLAAAAFGLPWLTHFADGGVSIALHIFWIALCIATLWTHGRRGLWLLLGAPWRSIGRGCWCSGSWPAHRCACSEPPL
jgi:hypothetical protein